MTFAALPLLPWAAVSSPAAGRGHCTQPTRWVHIAYGIVAVLWIPMIRFVNRGRSGRDETLACAIISLLEFVTAIRAMATA